MREKNEQQGREEFKRHVVEIFRVVKRRQMQEKCCCYNCRLPREAEGLKLRQQKGNVSGVNKLIGFYSLCRVVVFEPLMVKVHNLVVRVQRTPFFREQI